MDHVVRSQQHVDRARPQVPVRADVRRRDETEFGLHVAVLPGHAVDLGTRQEHAFADEVRDVAGRGTVIEVVGGIPLLDAALVHHADPVTDRERLALVVRDQHRGRRGRLQDGAHLQREPLAQLDVEAGERLVEQQQHRLRRQRARQRDPLLLSARQFMRIAGRLGAELGQRQHLVDPGPTQRRFQALESECDILADGQMRKQRKILEHHADLA